MIQTYMLALESLLPERSARARVGRKFESPTSRVKPQQQTASCSSDSSTRYKLAVRFAGAAGRFVARARPVSTFQGSRMPSGPVTPFPRSPRSLSEPAPELSRSHLLLSTADLYAARPQKPAQHFGKYVPIRERLDYEYHNVPTQERQLLQDDIIDSVLEQIEREIEQGGEDMGDTRKGCSGGSCPKLALFTAGGMGAGKGHTLKQFLKQGQVALPQNFIWSVYTPWNFAVADGSEAAGSTRTL